MENAGTDKPKSSMTIRQQIRLDDGMFDQVRKMADNEDRSLAMMLRILVREGLAQRSVSA